MTPKELTTTLNGSLYFEVKNFAWATRRSQQNVRFLMSYGNKFRKLNVEYFGGKPFIPYSELTEYPFAVPGRGNQEVYHYNEEGLPVFATK